MIGVTRTDVVGGAYEEWCLRPSWHEVFGSAGRAASAIAAMSGAGKVTLHCYTDARTAPVLEARSALEGVRLVATAVPATSSFRYTHGLHRPEVERPRSSYAPIVVKAQSILRFGMLEGDAVVHGERVVYDPQGSLTAGPFNANGSSAEELFVVLNEREARATTGLGDGATALELARATRALHGASGVVLKRGPAGALVLDGEESTGVPAFQTDTVWKIGSGDVFAAHFALGWAMEATLGALFTPADARSAEQHARVALDQALIDEVKAADVIVIGVPMVNFGITSQLKNWIDAIAKAGITFKYTASGPVGLLEGKKAVAVLTRGGIYRDQPHDTVVPYVKQTLGFLGITDIEFIYAEGLAMGPDAEAKALATARAEIAAIA